MADENLSLHAGSDRIVSGALHLLLGDALLDQILGRIDRIRVAGDGDDAISGTRCEDALLRDLDVCAA